MNPYETSQLVDQPATSSGDVTASIHGCFAAVTLACVAINLAIYASAAEPRWQTLAAAAFNVAACALNAWYMQRINSR